MENKLFVYGTLMYPEVLQSLTGERPLFTEAILADYRRFNIVDIYGSQRLYPAIFPEIKNEVRGQLVTLNCQSIEIIDRYETDEYEKKKVIVKTERRDELAAFTYVWKEGVKSLLDGEWNEVQFREKNLKAYVNDINDVNDDLMDGI